LDKLTKQRFTPFLTDINIDQFAMTPSPLADLNRTFWNLKYLR